MQPIVLFDGVCNFCNGAVNFIIRYDKAARFRFAPLQSEIGRKIREKHAIGEDVDSIVLIEGGRAFLRSDAAIRIASGLGGVFTLARAFLILPQGVRDWAYSRFAAYRYHLFGKKDVCMIPTPEVRDRFVS